MSRARAVAAAVADPEIPVLTIDDLGVLRDVRERPDGVVEVDVTPTYSGCPALDTIRADVTAALHEAGYREVTVHTVLSPPWTTDWMSAAGRRALAEHGIAPPAEGSRRRDGGPGGARGGRGTPVGLSVRCPRCGSLATREISRFGSTACKALYACSACAEPFESFKAI